jgi:hypothetical protein
MTLGPTCLDRLALGLDVMTRMAHCDARIGVERFGPGYACSSDAFDVVRFGGVAGAAGVT